MQARLLIYESRTEIERIKKMINKESIERALRGYYCTGCFNIYLNGMFDPNLENMNKTDLGTFLHEYVHFLQNISTPYGIFEANVHNIQAIETFMALNTEDEITIPYHTNYSPELRNRLLWISIMNGEPIKNVTTQIKIDIQKEMMLGLMDWDCRGKKCKNIAIDFYDTQGNEHQRMIGAIDIKESMASAFQSFIDPNVNHPDIPYNLLRMFCIKNYPIVGNDIKKFICLCYTSLFNLEPAYQFIQLCEEAEQNIELSGFDLFENFINSKKALSQGKSLPIHEQFDNLLKAYGQSIQGLTRCDTPYIDEILDRVRLVNGNVPILNVINTNQPFDISNIKTLVSALGIPYMHAENRGWFFPSMNGNGATDVIRLVSLMMLFDFLTQEKTKLRGMCPLIKMCGNSGTYCYDQPWLETGCAFDLMGQEIKLKSKKIKIQ